jgi:hypothetical protein
MNNVRIYLKRNIYNSKLNRENFIINKKKINVMKTQTQTQTQTKKFCTYSKFPNNNPKDPNINFIFIFMMAITGYYVNKTNKKFVK